MEPFQEEDIDPQIYSYAMAIVITAIIFVSIVFELTEEIALERSEEWIKPIVQTLFGELTILGKFTFFACGTTAIHTNCFSLFSLFLDSLNYFRVHWTGHVFRDKGGQRRVRQFSLLPAPWIFCSPRGN